MIDLRCGDALDVLRMLPDGMARCCVTSPPYFGLRDYGVAGQIGLEDSPAEYVARLVEIFREVRRVLADDGTLWLNLGDTYSMTTRGSGGVQRSGLRKDGRDEQSRLRSAEVSLGHRRLADRRSPLPPGLGPKQLLGIPWRVAFAFQADGWYLRSDIIWHKPSPMPESVRDRPTKSHEYLFLLAKRPRYYYDAEAIKEPLAEASKGRYGYAFGGTKGLALVEADRCGVGRRTSVIGSRGLPTGRNRRDVWTIASRLCKAAHFAVMPDTLVEPCILAGSAAGDTVLDPFVGAGTVPMVAARHGRHAIGIDLNPDYLDIARDRIAADAERRTAKPRRKPVPA